MKAIFRFLKVVGFIAVLLIFLGWLFVSAPFFAGVRQDIVSRLLTSAAQQPVTVEGDVRIKPRRISRIHASGVTVESVTIPDSELARLSLLEFDLDVFKLFDRIVDIDNLQIEGLQVNLVKDEQGRDSWKVPDRVKAEGKSDVEQPVAEKDGHILEFLRSRTATVTAAGLLFENQITGFVFDFELQTLTFEQLSGGSVLEVKSEGKVNGEAFSYFANIPREESFESRFSFGGFDASYNGVPTSDGHTGKLTVASGQLSDLFSVLRLDSGFDGTGQLQTDIVHAGDEISVQNLSAEFDFANGHNISVAGSVDQLVRMNGVDIVAKARLHPENQPPPRARYLRETRLVEVYAHITGDKSDIEFEELLLTTNALNQELDEIGPISVGSIRRSADSKLVIDDIAAQAGPRDAPYVTLQGHLGDALNLKDVDFSGQLSVPTSVLMPTIGADRKEQFGLLEGGFAFGDTGGALGLSAFELHLVNTELWSLDVAAQMQDITNPVGLDLSFQLGIAETSNFLNALGLEKTSSGSLAIGGAVSHDDLGIRTKLSLQTEVSDLASDIRFSGSLQNPVVDGDIISEALQIADLRDAVKTVMQLKKLPEVPQAQRKEVKPLVLPEKEIQRDKPVKPLVLDEEDLKAADLFDPVQLLKDTDLHIGMDLRKITGPRGTSSVSSQLVAKDGKAKLGPLDVRYGGGFFNLTADMDIENKPKEIALSGATGGWDFGEILQALEIDFRARGTLAGDFSVAGNVSSGKAFVNSMSGRAQLTMSEGQIATSLLELAGLGIFPWLFSEERRQGYTDIVCAVAPVVIRSGRVGSQSIVAETRSVQLVARGELDWRRDRIDLRVEPRRVGKPLSRSAWPFDVTGALSKPKFKLDIGGSRSLRADGADQMPENRKPCVPDIYQLR